MVWITVILLSIVTIVTVVNDKIIQNKGGDTFYFWEAEASEKVQDDK
jgi:hypothetical protein